MRLFLLIGLFQMFLSSCGQNPLVNQLSSTVFSSKIADDKATLLDVRTQHEFKNGHIKNAGQLNYYALDFRKKLLMLPKDHPVYLYCNTGYRSERAAEILVENGYSKVYNLEHGIMEWNIHNLPVVIDPDARPDQDNKYDYGQYQKLIHSDSLVFLDFYAPWCAPCRKMLPMMDSLKVAYHQRIELVKINVDASKKLMKQLQIVGVPYLVLYHKGNLLFSKNGFISRDELQDVFDSELTRINK